MLFHFPQEPGSYQSHGQWESLPSSLLVIYFDVIHSGDPGTYFPHSIQQVGRNAEPRVRSPQRIQFVNRKMKAEHPRAFSQEQHDADQFFSIFRRHPREQGAEDEAFAHLDLQPSVVHHDARNAKSTDCCQDFTLQGRLLGIEKEQFLHFCLPVHRKFRTEMHGGGRTQNRIKAHVA